MSKEEASEEQGILPEETSEEEKLDMELGKKDEEIYSNEGREKLVEDGEIADWEQGFMEGAEGRGSQSKCAHCHDLLSQDHTKIIEREYDGTIHVFCSNKCSESGPQ